MIKLIEFCKRNSPPGIELKQEYAVFIIGNMLSAVINIFAFLINYSNFRSQLFSYIDKERVLIDGAVMMPFYKVINFNYSLYVFIALIMIAYAFYHYAYFRQGSMSIYLMKRLPKKSELHKRVWTVPCIAVLATIAIAIATTLLCYIIYFIATPKACLPYNLGRYN